MRSRREDSEERPTKNRPADTSPPNVALIAVSPSKREYGGEINLFVQAHVNHITKLEFLAVYHTATTQP